MTLCEIWQGSRQEGSSKLKFIGPIVVWMVGCWLWISTVGIRPSTLSLGICSGSMLTLEELPTMWASNSAWLKVTYSWSPSCYKNIIEL